MAGSACLRLSEVYLIKLDFIQQLLNACSINRAAEQIALIIVAAELLELVKLLDCLHPFGDCFHAQVVGHRDHGAHQILVIVALAHLVQKSAVNFKHADRKILEVGQR